MRAVQGIGAAIMFAVSLALPANAYPEYVDGLHYALLAGAALAAAGAVAAWYLIAPTFGAAALAPAQDPLVLPRDAEPALAAA